jgi:hypothetical protein
MTFLEAALAVLRQERRPLHYREITKLAIERDYLSHIGKMPDQAMQTRLSTAARRGIRDVTIHKVGPGTYALEPGDAPHASATPETAGALPDAVAADPAADVVHDAVDEAPLLAAGEAAPGLRPHPDRGSSPAETTARSRRRRKRHRRQTRIDAPCDLSALLASLVESRGRSMQVSELASAAAARGLVSGDALRVERAVRSIVRTDVVLRARHGARARLVIDGDDVDLSERGPDAESAALEQRISAESEQLALLARARVASELPRLPLTSLIAIVKACLDAAGLGDLRRFSIVSEHEAQLELARPEGRSSFTAVVLKGGGDAGDPRRETPLPAPQASLLVTIGPELRGAPPAEVWDAQEVAARMERLGLGYRVSNLPLHTFDDEFFRRNP